MAIVDKAATTVAKLATRKAAVGAAAKNVAEAGAKGIKKGVEAAGRSYTGALREVAREAANTSGDEVVNRAVREAGEKKLRQATTKELSRMSEEQFSKLNKKQLADYANDLGIKTNSKMKKADLINEIKTVASPSAPTGSSGGGGGMSLRGPGKGTLAGAAIGAVAGAGVGGIAGVATGADEDNMKAMVAMGALTGGVGGAIVGKFGKFGGAAASNAAASSAAETASNIANGSANTAVNGGAKGLLGRAGASAQSFADKIDDTGSNIAKRISRDDRLEFAKALKKRSGDLTSQEALDIANRAWSSSQEAMEKGIVYGHIPGSDVYNKLTFDQDTVQNIISSAKKANTIGGAAQGAIIGTAGGALVGGVAGGIDEDESFIGGALKGGLIGGALGGIGGGASGYFNNNARILSNTTANVGSLFK